MKHWITALSTLLLLASCEKEGQDCPGPSEKNITLAGFTGVNAAETFHIIIKKGDVYNIKAKGCANDLSDLQAAVQNDGALNLRYNSYKKNRYNVYVEITMPQLEFLDLGGESNTDVSGFAGQQSALQVTIGGNAGCMIKAAPQYMNFTLGGAGSLQLYGGVEELKGTAGGASTLNAYNSNALSVDIKTDGTAKAYVLPVHKLKATAGGDSRIYYKGAPPELLTETNGTAKIIHE